jgi:ABC-2 type transport system ATP-binding protein
LSAAVQPASAFAARDVRKSFGRLVVLDGLTLDVPRGCVLGLLGENGSGKTTLLKILLGLLPSDSGSTSVAGEPSAALPPAVRARIGYVAQSPDQFRWLTGKAMLAYVGSFYPTYDAEYAHDLAARWRISLRTPIEVLSPGQQQRLSIVRALATRPDLIVLDEPIASIDPATRIAITEELLAVTREREATVIFSSHITGDLERLCSHFAVIASGKVAFLGSTSVIRSFARVIVRGEEGRLPNAPFEHVLHVRKNHDGERVLVVEGGYVDAVLERSPGWTATTDVASVETVLSEWMR